MSRIHVGLLDGLRRDEIAARFAPVTGRPELITRLLDGTVITIDRQAAQAAAKVKLSELEERGCTTILLLCTGQFADLACRKAWLVEPDPIVRPSVAALAQDRQVGIVVPLASQIDSESGKWAGLSRRPICAVASPYAGDDSAVAKAA